MCINLAFDLLNLNRLVKTQFYYKIANLQFKNKT